VLDDAVKVRHENFPDEDKKYLPISIEAILQPGEDPIFYEPLCEMEDLIRILDAAVPLGLLREDGK
jgi:hypothetical protein